MDQLLVREGVAKILTGLGCDLDDPNFRDTPARVSRAYPEILSGLEDLNTKIDAILSRTFPCGHDQMVVAKGIRTYGLCPHHLLPVHYDITVGYLPGDQGQVLGLSKLYRLVQFLAGRPVLQETMVNDVTKALMRIPGCIGAGCVARGEHLCITMRGVRQEEAMIITSGLAGCFLSDENGTIRSEFLSLAR